MPIRTIKPSFFRSRSLARCSRDTRLTFAGLWTEADSAGIGVADPRILKGAIWPLDDDITPDIVQAHLEELAETGHIDLYEVDGDWYYAVLNWERHQSAGYRRGDSQHPKPESAHSRVHAARTTVQNPTSTDETPACDIETEDCTHLHESCTQECAVREGKGREDIRAPSADDAFTVFWDRYPRKVAKAACVKAWRRLKPPERKLALEALPRHVESWRRSKTEERFIPHPASWLNAHRFDDDITSPGTRAATLHVDTTTGAQLSDYALRNS